METKTETKAQEDAATNTTTQPTQIENSEVVEILETTTEQTQIPEFDPKKHIRFRYICLSCHEPFVRPSYETISQSNSTTSDGRIFGDRYSTTTESKGYVCPYCNSLNFIDVNTNRGMELMKQYNIIPFRRRNYMDNFFIRTISNFFINIFSFILGIAIFIGIICLMISILILILG